MLENQVASIFMFAVLPSHKHNYAIVLLASKTLHCGSCWIPALFKGTSTVHMGLVSAQFTAFTSLSKSFQPNKIKADF